MTLLTIAVLMITLTWEGSIQMRVPASAAASTSSSTFSYGCTVTHESARCSATSEVTWDQNTHSVNAMHAPFAAFGQQGKTQQPLRSACKHVNDGKTWHANVRRAETPSGAHTRVRSSR